MGLVECLRCCVVALALGGGEGRGGAGPRGVGLFVVENQYDSKTKQAPLSHGQQVLKTDANYFSFDAMESSLQGLKSIYAPILDMRTC